MCHVNFLVTEVRKSGLLLMVLFTEQLEEHTGLTRNVLLVVPRPLCLGKSAGCRNAFISLGQVGRCAERVECIELEVFVQELCGLFGTLALFRILQ